MSTKLDAFNKKQLKSLPEIRPGYTIIVHQKIKEGEKERIQPFKGLVIAKKHGAGINGTITVRKISGGIGVERTFPIHSPKINKIEVVGKAKVRRAKLYFLRERTGKSARLKRKEERGENATEPSAIEATPKKETPGETTKTAE
ncbi:MAG: 50S ribosomal protein L19 [Candidatus Portnoybacteria bacterium CG09_land_8_20_14_0_10_44_13]|uniref:Large ribosomal subunit protein bL19 n=3 Tax=Candidatus Portnoyibacteriota TaxID=1817913 RepID=A0A2H0KQ22_9BACT|nr:MAG: 50S ribosomal protein L19 [Candidatus Portnoybacteria bacterium CG11_big_fil_rev_8_21_14_0_20_44_10]PIS16598.1 MAG: 50S ribosomal protein L19 [Candidatus Portnoybacteria bacterium CG09_land_8_20_14_0_10_44_13]PIZ71788.1 MAG: 50S ribosomal protein L19 [Candidatus Portnoybacteria bacterium CG_4_10_14_0_2_um_filter_44_20]